MTITLAARPQDEAAVSLEGDIGTFLERTSGCRYELIERLPDLRRSPDERIVAAGVGPLLSAAYEARRDQYDAMPKSKDEANARGVKSFDALQVSVLDLGEGVLAPIRYSYLLAYQAERKACLERGDLDGVTALAAENPLVLGPAVYAVTMYRGEPHLMMQIKGNAVGAGEIHSGLVAGGISIEEFLTAPSVHDMIVAAAIRQTREEIGLEVDAAHIGDPTFARYEDATGNMGIGFCLSGFRGSDVIDSFRDHVSGKLIGSADDTAKGVALLPTQGLALIGLSPNGSPQLDSHTEVIVSSSGIEIKESASRLLRPAAQGYLAAIERGDILRVLMERSGM